MSLRVSEWAWTVAGLDAGAKLVLLALADHADDAGLCWPSLDRLAERTGRNRTTVQRALRTLETAGLVSSSSGSGRRSSRYQVHYAPATDIHTGCTTHPLPAAEGPHHAPATDPRGRTTPPQGLHGAFVAGAPRRPNSKEPSTNPRARPSSDAYPWHGDPEAAARRRLELSIEHARLTDQIAPIERSRRQQLIAEAAELEALEELAVAQ